MEPFPIEGYFTQPRYRYVGRGEDLGRVSSGMTDFVTPHGKFYPLLGMDGNRVPGGAGATSQYLSSILPFWGYKICVS